MVSRGPRPDVISEGELLWYDLRDWFLADAARSARSSTVSLTQWADPKLRLAKFVESAPVSVACVRLVTEASRLLSAANASILDATAVASLEGPVVDGLKQFCVDPLGMSFADRNVQDFAFRAFKCALISRKSISPSARIECYRDAIRLGGIDCYSCGVRLANSLSRTMNIALDHLWPRAYGGSSDAENLLPICDACNLVKADRITWDVFGVVNDYSLMRHGKNALLLTKMALHRKAAAKLAEDLQITIKEAYLKLGAHSVLQEVDPVDGNFFFNLRADNAGAIVDIW